MHIVQCLQKDDTYMPTFCSAGGGVPGLLSACAAPIDDEGVQALLDDARREDDERRLAEAPYA